MSETEKPRWCEDKNAYFRHYHKQNKKICDCGSVVSGTNYRKHLQTKKHVVALEFLARKAAVKND